jgi:hypothetical protein
MKTKKMLKKLRSNQIMILLVLLAITILIVIPPARANYITMANPQGIAERDILVYNATGQLQGLYNSTSTIELNGSQDYIFSMKPLQTNPFEDPADWLVHTAFPFMQSQVIGIFLCLVFLATLTRWGK